MRKLITTIILLTFTIQSSVILSPVGAPKDLVLHREALRPTALIHSKARDIITPTRKVEWENTSSAGTKDNLEYIDILRQVYADMRAENPQVKEMLFRNTGKGTYLPSTDLKSLFSIFNSLIKKGAYSGKLLEFGSGSGEAAIVAAICGFRVKAVEWSKELVLYSRDALERFKELLRKEGISLPLEIELVQGDALDYIAPEYDIIFMSLGGTIDSERIQSRINQMSSPDTVIVVQHPKMPFDRLKPLRLHMLRHPHLFGSIEGKTMLYGPRSLNHNPRPQKAVRQIDSAA